METRKDSDLISSKEKNYKLLRRVYNSIFSSIAENFLIYPQALGEKERQEIDSDITANVFGSVNETFSAYDLLTTFDFFCFVNGRFSTATKDTFAPNGEKLHKVGEE